MKKLLLTASYLAAAIFVAANGVRCPCCQQQRKCSIAVLNVGGMNDNVQQETQRVDQDVPLATFDLLARVVAPKDRARTFTDRLRPPCLAGGIMGSTIAHSASVRSLG
jgi:hypothetical protein